MSKSIVYSTLCHNLDFQKHTLVFFLYNSSLSTVFLCNSLTLTTHTHTHTQIGFACFKQLDMGTPPIPIAYRSGTSLAVPDWLNNGDNAWQMISATLVGLQSVPGLVILYGSIVKKKWAVNSAFMALYAFAAVVIQIGRAHV